MTNPSVAFFADWNDACVMATVGSRIRALREALGMSQYQLAQESGIRPETISRYERDKIAPGSKAVSSMARVLGVGPGDILGSLDRSTSQVDDDLSFAERAIAFVAPGATAETRSRLMQALESAGFSDGGDEFRVVGLLKSELATLEAEQSGMTPKTQEGRRVEPPKPREGARKWRPGSKK